MKHIDWLDQWLNNYIKPTVKQRTFEHYEDIVHRQIVPRLGDYDLEALLFFSNTEEEDTQFTLDQMNVMSGGKNIIPTASVALKIGKRTKIESGTGNGPVDAVFNCITRLTGIRCELTKYNITAKGSGMNAQGQVDVDVLYHGRQYHGKGLSTDVIEASALALIHACNSIYRAQIIEQEKEEK